MRKDLSRLKFVERRLIADLYTYQATLRNLNGVKQVDTRADVDRINHLRCKLTEELSRINNRLELELA